MRVSRNLQFDALLAKVQTTQLNGAPAFVICSRRYQSWEQMPDSELPACFLTKGFEHASQERTYGETKWRVRALLWVYCLHSPDADSTPGELLNDLLDAVDTVLQPSSVEDRQTLGGIVTNCFIDGEVLVAEGMQADNRISIAVIPVTLETGI